MIHDLIFIDTTGWDDLEWDIWRSALSSRSRFNIERWLAGRLLPAGLSAAGLESLFREQCPGQYVQPHHFAQITMI